MDDSQVTRGWRPGIDLQRCQGASAPCTLNSLPIVRRYRYRFGHTAQFAAYHLCSILDRDKSTPSQHLSVTFRETAQGHLELRPASGSWRFSLHTLRGLKVMQSVAEISINGFDRPAFDLPMPPGLPPADSVRDSTRGDARRSQPLEPRGRENNCR